MSPRSSQLRYASVFITSFFCIAISTNQSSHGQDDTADKITEIIEKWISISKSVATTRLQCWHITIISDPQQIANAPTRDMVNVFIRDKLFSKLHSPDRNKLLRQESEAFQSQSAPVLSGEWRTLDIVDDGIKLRNDSAYASPGKDSSRQSRVRSSDEEIEYNSKIRQALIKGPTSKVRMDSLADIRYAPELPQYIGDPEVTLMHLGNNRVVLSRGEHQIEFDNSSGFIYHATWLTGGNTAFYDYWQEEPMSSEGIEVPAVSARAYYRKTADGESRLIRASVYFVEAAKFNEEISAKEFVVAVPKGTKIANKTASAQTIDGVPIVSRAPTDVENVKEFRLTPPHVASSKPRSYGYLIVVNIVGIIGFGIYVLIKNSRRARGLK